MIEAFDIHFSYAKSGAEILRGLSLSVADGEFVALLGTNGAGKSTLVNIISGFERQNLGRVLINSADTTKTSAIELAGMRAVLEQSFEPAFDPTAFELVLMGRYARTGALGNSDEDIAAAAESLRMTGLSEFADRRYSTLSGGEKRRANISRVLAQIYSDNGDYKGKNLLLDEPCAALDPAHSLLALKTAKALSKAGASVLCILHNPNQAFRFADKVALLKDGKIFFEGSPSEAANACMLSEVYGADCKITSAPDGFPVAIFC